MTSSLLYFDYAAATPMDARVLEVMTPYFGEKFFNPSSPYRQAIEVRQEYRAAKEQLARHIGATADELVMTAGATESINLAISSFSGHKICSAIEHDSVLNAIKKDGDYTIVPVTEQGRINTEALVSMIRDTTELVSVALANHELGTIQPITDIAGHIARIRTERLEKGNTTPLYLHCDASQGFGLVDLHVARLRIDMLTLNAAKIYGPKQVGVLWVKPGVVISPNLVGGGQELGLRSGTENVAGVIGFAKAAQLSEKYRKSEIKRLSELRNKLQKLITQEISSAVVSGDQRHRLVNFLHISFPYIDAERLVFLLEMDGVAVATGSACAANKGTRSHVLGAINLPDEVADGSLRITLGRHTTEEDIDALAGFIIKAVKKEADRTKVTDV